MAYVPIGSVRPYEGNPRQNDGAVEAVAESIKEFGWRQPIVVDAGGTVVAGHTRLRAAQRLGMDEVPVVVASDLTPEQVRAYRLADNRLSELAEWDMDLLAQELDSLTGLDMSRFGFEDDISSMEFMEFDGEGDGGGSIIRNGTKFRCMIGPLMFEIPDPTHELYAACGEIPQQRFVDAITSVIEAERRGSASRSTSRAGPASSPTRSWQRP